MEKLMNKLELKISLSVIVRYLLEDSLEVVVGPVCYFSRSLRCPGFPRDPRP